jgi:hypothetical protein
MSFEMSNRYSYDNFDNEEIEKLRPKVAIGIDFAVFVTLTGIGVKRFSNDDIWLQTDKGAELNYLTDSKCVAVAAAGFNIIALLESGTVLSWNLDFKLTCDVARHGLLRNSKDPHSPLPITYDTEAFDGAFNVGNASDAFYIITGRGRYFWSVNVQECEDIEDFGFDSYVALLPAPFVSVALSKEDFIAGSRMALGTGSTSRLVIDKLGRAIVARGGVEQDWANSYLTLPPSEYYEGENYVYVPDCPDLDCHWKSGALGHFLIALIDNKGTAWVLRDWSTPKFRNRFEFKQVGPADDVACRDLSHEILNEWDVYECALILRDGKVHAFTDEKSFNDINAEPSHNLWLPLTQVPSGWTRTPLALWLL